MRNILNNLLVWYPCLRPENISEGLADIASAIKDIRLVIPVPYGVHTQDKMMQVYSVKLNSIDTENATFDIDICIDGDVYTITQTIAVQDITEDKQAPSFVIVDKTALEAALTAVISAYTGDDTDKGMKLPIHPVCCVFISEALGLEITSTSARFDKNEATPGDIKITPKTLSFSNGNNTVVTKTDDGISILGASAIGLGKYKKSPFIDEGAMTTPFDITPPKGILSINGIGGDVYIAGSNSITVDLSKGGSATDASSTDEPATSASATISMTLTVPEKTGNEQVIT